MSIGDAEENETAAQKRLKEAEDARDAAEATRKENAVEAEWAKQAAEVSLLALHVSKATATDTKADATPRLGSPSKPSTMETPRGAPPVWSALRSPSPAIGHGRQRSPMVAASVALAAQDANTKCVSSRAPACCPSECSKLSMDSGRPQSARLKSDSRCRTLKTAGCMSPICTVPPPSVWRVSAGAASPGSNSRRALRVA